MAVWDVFSQFSWLHDMHFWKLESFLEHAQLVSSDQMIELQQASFIFSSQVTAFTGETNAKIIKDIVGNIIIFLMDPPPQGSTLFAWS